MKTQFSKKVLAILASAVLLVCSFAGTFVVSAEDPIATPATVGGVKYYIVANAVDDAQPTVTIDLGDGAKTYNTQSFLSAYSAAVTASGEETVVAMTEGTYGVDSGYLSGSGASKVSFIGYGTTADKIILQPTDYFRVYPKAYFDNFTLDTGDCKVFVGASGMECGPNFRCIDWTLWHPLNYAPSDTTVTDRKVVLDGTLVRGKNFSAFGFSDYGAQTAWGGEGHLYEATINNLTFGDYSYTDCGRILLGNYRKSLTYTGNYIFTVNNATPHASRPYIDVSKASGAVTTFNGTATVILNNGMASKWTVTDEAKAAVDYVVTAPAGGYVTVKEDTKKSEVPTFVITHDNGFVPVVNGTKLELTNGVYEYTPTATGDINVTFVDNRIYNVDGETTVFAAADGSVTYSGTGYAAYATFEDAYNAVIAQGDGTIVVEGAMTWYGDYTTTNKVKVIGVDSNASMTIPHYGSGLPGKVEFDSIKLQAPASGEQHWNLVSSDLTIGENASITNNSIGIQSTGANAAASLPNNGTIKYWFSAPSTIYFLRFLGNAIGTAEKTVNMQVVMDGTGYRSSYNNGLGISGGSINGSFTFVINDSSRFEKKGGTAKTIDINGTVGNKLSVIFNNGITDVVVNEVADTVDYRLNVGVGGYAYVKTEGTTTTAPTFVIAHNNGYVPLIDGVEMTKTGDEYIFAPETTGTYNITFYDPDAPQVYEIEGEKFAFAAADGKVDYNDVTYNAYETFELAYKAIIGQGGTIVVEGAQNLYTESTAAKAIKIIGLGRDVSKLVLPGSYNNIYGEIEIDEIALSSTSGSGDGNVAVDRFTIGPNTKSYGNLWFIGFVASQPGETCYLEHNGSDTAFMLNVSQKSWKVPADTNIHEIYNGGYVNHDIQVNGAVQGNMTYFFNDVSRFNTKKVTVSKDATGVLTLVFNNGITNMTIADDNGYVDYIVNVAEGGYANIKTEGDVQTAPVFVITAPAGKVPVVNGKLLKATEGEYLYQPTDKETNITFTDELKVDVLTGAAVRFGTPTGLRFITNINGLSGLSTIGAVYEAYTLIAPIDYVNAVGTFTKEAFDAADKTYLNIKLEKDAYIGDGVDLPAAPLYNAAIVNIKKDNYGRGFAARSYVVITYADGHTETIYSDFSETDNVRSVKEVAQACLYTEDYDNDNQKAILEGFVG